MKTNLTTAKWKSYQEIAALVAIKLINKSNLRIQRLFTIFAGNDFYKKLFVYELYCQAVKENSENRLQIYEYIYWREFC